MTPKLPFQGILFDLDGTLVDTAEDLTEALALALASHGVSIEDKRKLLRTLASHGSLAWCKPPCPKPQPRNRSIYGKLCSGNMMRLTAKKPVCLKA